MMHIQVKMLCLLFWAGRDQFVYILPTLNKFSVKCGSNPGFLSLNFTFCLSVISLENCVPIFHQSDTKTKANFNLVTWVFLYFG